MGLADMIAAQRKLQENHGHHFETMTDQERTDYVKEQVLACIDELHEALGEVGWKSWARSRHINPHAFFGELRDAWQFLTNLMLVVEPDPDKLAGRLEAALFEKLAINYARQHEGYDGVTGKCPTCRRALEEITITEVRMTTDGKHVRYICVCGANIPTEVAKPYVRD